MGFALSVGDAARGLAMAFVALAAAWNDCTKALDSFGVAAERKPDDADST